MRVRACTRAPVRAWQKIITKRRERFLENTIVRIKLNEPSQKWLYMHTHVFAHPITAKDMP
jgi:hypothetical protein